MHERNIEGLLVIWKGLITKSYDYFGNYRVMMVRMNEQNVSEIWPKIWREINRDPDTRDSNQTAVPQPI